MGKRISLLLADPHEPAGRDMWGDFEDGEIAGGSTQNIGIYYRVMHTLVHGIGTYATKNAKHDRGRELP